MDDQFLTPSRFRILQEIVKSPSSASQIARDIKMSIPYVLNQITLLEAKGFISKKEESSSKTPGKPKKIFTLSHETTNIITLQDGFAKKFSISQPSQGLNKYFRLLSFINKQKQCEFSKYYWSNLEEFHSVQSIGLIEIQDDKVELLAVTSADHLESLRKKIANQTIINASGRKTTFVCWVHTKEELKKGCELKDFYYENLKKRVIPMFDPSEVFQSI